MKRKIIQQKESFTITLPKKWISHNKLSGNDELTVLEQNDKLLIVAHEGRAQTKKSLHVTSNSAKSLRSQIAAFYRRGIDVIDVTSDEKFQFTKINTAVESLVGAVILEQSDRHIVIECSTGKNVDINALIDKLFVTLGYMFALFETDIDTKQCQMLNNSLIRLRDYIQRLIFLTQFGEDKNTEYQMLIYAIERIANILLKISKKYDTVDIKSSILQFEEVKKAYLKKDLELAIKASLKIVTARNAYEFDNAIDAILLEYLNNTVSRVRSILL